MMIINFCMKVRMRRVGASYAPPTCDKSMPDHNKGWQHAFVI